MIDTNIPKERNVRSSNESLTPKEQEKLMAVTIGHGNLKATEVLAEVSGPILRSARRGNQHSPETIKKIRDFLNTL